MLKDKVIVITGGAGKLGKEFVKSVAMNEAVAIIADIDENLAINVKNSILNEIENVKNDSKTEPKTAKIDTIKLDITSKDSLNLAIETLHNKYNKIDALVNNAYPRTKNWGKKAFFELDYDDMAKNLSMHLGGYILTSQEFARYFKNQGFGNIVSISSIMGVYAPKFENYIGTNMQSPIEYSVIKAGIIHMSRYLGKFLKDTGIRSNVIAPGGILENQPESFLKAYRKCCVSKGMLDAKDLCGTLIYLLSDLSEFVSGQTIIVDDGWGL
ncbi:oxidoreductase [Campylobacter sputorum]|uniref:oxidoreductase n=1 Tax=Campylobacter sputorum TaxID=206 RepID=UPI00053BE2E5|nr:oxidoreductase [Campylobacter sputorum]